MGRMKDLWHQLCDAAQQVGVQGYDKQDALLTDAEMLQQVRQAAEQVGGLAVELVDQIADDEQRMAELREAYDQGRRPSRIDMDRVVWHVEQAGVQAYVQQTGGGCATIYAGTLDEWPDEYGDRRYAVAAGPGWFEGPRWTRPYGEATDFAIGPDDEGRTTPVQPNERTHPQEVAALIVEAVRGVEVRRQRIRDAVDVAAKEFWASISEQFPEVKSAGIPFGAAERFTTALREAAGLALHLHQPEGGIAETALAGSTIARERQLAAAKRVAAHITESGIDPDDLAALVLTVAGESAKQLAADGDYYPLGDQLVEEELAVWANDLAADTNAAGVDDQADFLVTHLGELAAIERVDEVAKAGGDGVENCPASGPTQPVNDQEQGDR